MRYSQPYREALAIQRAVAKQALDTKCTRKELCMLARAFKELEELKLRLRMKGAPKAVDALKIHKARRSASGPLFVEDGKENVSRQST